MWHVCNTKILLFYLFALEILFSISLSFFCIDFPPLTLWLSVLPFPKLTVCSAFGLGWVWTRTCWNRQPGTAVLQHGSTENSCLLLLPDARYLGSRSCNMSCSARGSVQEKEGKGRKASSLLCVGFLSCEAGIGCRITFSPFVRIQTSLHSCTGVWAHHSPCRNQSFSSWTSQHSSPAHPHLSFTNNL